MKRDFTNLNTNLNILMQDVYEQPVDFGHTTMAQEVIDNWISNIQPCEKVLDVGCGQGFTAPMFMKYGIRFVGVALGRDVEVCKLKGLEVYSADFHFLDVFADGTFDLVFSRHSLEHSPMPLLALMEWKRIAKNWLCVVLPNPEAYSWTGLNHYSVLHPNQAEFLLDRAGWHIIWTDFSNNTELRYMCEKKHKSHYDEYVEGKEDEQNRNIGE